MFLRGLVTGGSLLRREDLCHEAIRLTLLLERTRGK